MHSAASLNFLPQQPVKYIGLKESGPSPSGFPQQRVNQIQEPLFIVTHALVTAYLDYCKVLYLRMPLKNNWKL